MSREEVGIAIGVRLARVTESRLVVAEVQNAEIGRPENSLAFSNDWVVGKRWDIVFVAVERNTSYAGQEWLPAGLLSSAPNPCV
jgi:hypothetical protein